MSLDITFYSIKCGVTTCPGYRETCHRWPTVIKWSLTTILRLKEIRYCSIVHGKNFMAIVTTPSVVIWFSTGTLGVFATLVYVFPTLSTSILFCNLCYILLWISPRSVVSRHTVIANFATLIQKKLYTVWQFLLYYMVITILHMGSLS